VLGFFCFVVCALLFVLCCLCFVVCALLFVLCCLCFVVEARVVTSNYLNVLKIELS